MKARSSSVRLCLYAGCLGLLAQASLSSSNAKELYGVDIPTRLGAGDSGLVLNGTALRSVWGFKVYVVGLYLSEPTSDARTIMSHDRGSKRIHITMLRPVTPERFVSTIQENIDCNFSDSEERQYASEIGAFFQCFDGGSSLQKGSEINIDYLPGTGTLVAVDGKQHPVIAGDDFYHALLRLWIGKPLQSSLKTGLLGQAH